MSTIFYDNLGTSVDATITLASLASSATAGRQSTAVVLEASSRVPDVLDILFQTKLQAGTPANDKAVYLFVARSADGTNYESGPPAVGASDAAYTFSNGPSTNPIGLTLLGALSFVATTETQAKMFRLWRPPAKLVFVVLNFAGFALSATAGDSFIKYRPRNVEGV